MSVSKEEHVQKLKERTVSSVSVPLDTAVTDANKVIPVDNFISFSPTNT